MAYVNTLTVGIVLGFFAGLLIGRLSKRHKHDDERIFRAQIKTLLNRVSQLESEIKGLKDD